MTLPASPDPGSSAAADPLRSSPAAKAHALTVTPAHPIAGEQTTFSGHVPAGVRRPVRLQSHATGTWRTVATGRTSVAGRFGLSTTASRSTRPVRYRVVAPSNTAHHHRMPAVRSAPTTVTSLAQDATLTGPVTTAPGADVVLDAAFDPVRTGRPVEIQRATATGWETVESTQEDAAGLATWHGSAPDTTGSFTYRAVALAWHRAPATSGTHDVAVVPAIPSGVALLSKSTGNLTHVTCATTAFCVAIDDNGNATTYDGTSWTAPTPVDTRIRLSDVSCPTADFCMAVDDSGYAITFDGSGWSAPVRIDPNGRPSAVSCASATFCASVGFDGTATTYDGTSWSAPVTVSENFADVSCPATDHCVALGFDGLSFRYDGTSWSGLDAVAVARQTTALSCADPTFCVAVDSAGHGYTFNGASWSEPTVASGHLYSVWCPTRSYCAAGTATGTVTTFDGTAWSAPTSSGLAQSSDIACPSTTMCVLVGDSGAAVRTGTTWAASQPDPHSGGMVSVSCVDATSCRAADGDGRVFSWNGTSWGNPVTVDPNGHPTALSCANRSLCALVDDEGRASTFDGTAWTEAAPIAASALRSVSCAPTSSPLGDTACVAVGDDGAVRSLGAGGWVDGSVVDDVALRDVSCATRAWCVAADVQGRSVGYDGGTWGSPVPITGLETAPAPSLSCPTTGFCLATLRWGGVRSYDGTSWNDAGFLHAESSLTGLQAVSCASETSCTAALDDGTAQYDGDRWSDPDLELVTGLTDISCPTTDFCAAVDRYGYARVLD